MGKTTLQSRHTPDRAEISLLSQRLGLGALYATTLPQPLRDVMGRLALALEQNPRQAAILREQAQGVHAELPPAFRMAAEYQQNPNPEALPDLRAAAYQGVLRIALPLFLVLGFVMVAGLRLWVGEPDAEGPARQDPTEYPALQVSPWLALALFTGWQLLSWGPLERLTGSLFPPGLGGLLAGQFSSYILFLALLWGLTRGTGWRPWGRLDGGWLARGYLLCLLLMTAADGLVWAGSGSDPFHRDPVLGILLHASTSERWLLTGWIVVVGPAFEELLFRGFLLSAFRAAWGERKALLLSALLFALAHGNLWGWPSLFLGGLVLGRVALKTGSCTTAMALHGLWNLTWLCHVAMMLPGDLW